MTAETELDLSILEDHSLEQRCVFIYGLVDPRDVDKNQGFSEKSVRYIGKTVKSIERRCFEHVRSAERGSNLPVHRWIRKLFQDGVTPKSILLETLDEIDWVVSEQRWIKNYVMLHLKNC